MSEFVPEILYNDKKLPHIQSILDPKPAKKNIVIEGKRGAGCLVIGGGTSSYEITVTGILLAADTQLPDGTALSKPNGTEYEKIMEQKNYLETVMAAENVDRVLKVEKADSSYDSYTVRRLEDISYPESQRISVQEYVIRLKVVSP